MKYNRVIYILIFPLIFFTLKPAAFGQTISTEHIYAMNSPGIVMIQAVFSATVYVNKLNMNQPMFNKLVDSVKKLDTTGQILTPAQKLDIVVKAMYKTPFRFFSAGEDYFRQVHRVQGNGTGFLITGDGYVVTNCHIIDRDSAYIRNKFILSTFDAVTEKNINALQASWAMTFSEQQRDMLSNAYGVVYSQVSSMILFDLKKEIFVLYRTDAKDNEMVTIKKQGDLIIKGRAMPGKDVAILKIHDVKNLPTLPLSKESIIKIGAQVLVLGYPGVVSSNAFLDLEAGMEPTLTKGIVSAIKKSIGGWRVIQMDALISHGSSGSPVCNDKGEVIGLATFGSLEQGGGSLVSGYNFAIPVPVVKEYLDSAGLQPKLSESTILFNEGLQLFYQEFYRKALEKFEGVKKINSSYPQLNFYSGQCNQKIARGNDKQSPPRKYVFWIMIAIAILSGVYFFYRIRYPRS